MVLAKAPPVDPITPGINGLSRALADKLVAARAKMPRRFAATSNGVSPITFDRWIQIGSISSEDPICVYLAKKIYEVEGQDVGETVEDLKELRKISATAVETYLKVMHPNDFGGHQRTGPDEFQDQERNRGAQDKLLASPPPRMLAKLHQHRWHQIPAGASAEETAAVLALLEQIRMRVTSAAALAEKAGE